MPTPAMWYMNPIFLASAGAFFAVGLLMLVTIYFVLTKMKPKSGSLDPDGLCPLEVCRSHEGILIRLEGIDSWIKEHKEDYKEIRRRIDELERGPYGRRKD
jgi:hypothetical protein